MTALPQYERLEAPGIWRETPEAQRREVIVSFGDATLVIADDRSARALTHWSLPAIARRNPGRRPALYAPSEEEGEELEIDDPTMIEAIEKVQAAIEARRPHPGRLRRFATLGTGAVVALAALIWLPGALVDQAARVAPYETRAAIGRALLDDLARTTGTPCHSTAGDAALEALAERLVEPSRIVVVPRALKGARLLPGQIVVLGADVLDGPDTPEVAAGEIIAAEVAGAGNDPLRALLHRAGAMAALKLLTTGDLPEGAVQGAGAALLATPPAAPEAEPLLAAFARAGVSATPYAYARDPSGESVLGLIEADPFKGAPAPRPVLTDADWLALKDICN